MYNTYDVILMNDSGVVFDSRYGFTNLTIAKKWAKGRGEKCHALIHANGNPVSFVYTPRK